MSMPLAERRQIENEMIFRRANELVGANLDEVDDNHREDGNPHLVRNEDIMLQFKCECSDEKCDARISVKLRDFQSIHKNRDAFIIKLNHQVESIEKIILTENNYSVVEKNNSTPEPGNKLNKTKLNNI